AAEQYLRTRNTRRLYLLDDVTDCIEGRGQPRLVGGNRRDEAIRVPRLSSRFGCQPGDVTRVDGLRKLEDVLRPRSAALHHDADGTCLLQRRPEGPHRLPAMRPA